MTIDSARDLLEQGELVDVRMFQFSAELRDEPDLNHDDDDVSQKLDVGLGRFENTVEVRVRIAVETREATYSATGAMQFRYEGDDAPSEETIREFAEMGGIQAVYPYLREAIQSASVRLSQPPLTLPLLRLGRTVLNPNDSE